MTTSLSLIALPDGKELDHRLRKLRSKKCMHDADTVKCTCMYTKSTLCLCVVHLCMY